MDNTKYIAIPTSGPTYTRNLALCKFQLGLPVSADDMKQSSAVLSGSSLLLYLRWLSCVVNTTLSDFDSWVAHVRQTVEAAAQACGWSFFSKDEQELLSLGLAVRTYPFNEGPEPLARYCPPDILRAFLTLPMDKPERAWAMEAVGNQMLDLMTADPDRDLHLMLRLMAVMLQVHSEMEKLA